MKARRLAVFDIDGTIFRSSLVVELVEAMIGAGIFDEKVRDIYSKSYKRWLNREDDYEKYINAVVKAYINNIEGVEYKKYSTLASKVIKFHSGRVYKYTRDLVKKLKKQNYFLLAISHSPNEAVQIFAKTAGFDAVYGRIFEVDKNGKMTGKMVYKELIDHKEKVILRVLSKHNLTLKGSIGVGDTENDIPVFNMVEKPICFNPNAKLYKYAKHKKWQIVVERKDVIYKI